MNVQRLFLRPMLTNIDRRFDYYEERWKCGICGLYREANWKRLRSMADQEIDFSDIPELDEKFFLNAAIRKSGAKDLVTLKIDHKTLQWFKLHSKNYETLINKVLKTYVNQHK